MTAAPASEEPLVPSVTPFAYGMETRAMQRFPTGGHPMAPDDITGVSIGDLDLFRMRLPHQPLPIQRPARERDCLLLAHANTSVTIHTSGRKSMVAEPGQMLVLLNSTPHVVAARSATCVTGVILPAALLTEFAVKPPTRPSQVQPRTTLSAPMWEFVGSLLEQPLPWQSLSAYFAEKLLHELIGSVMLETAGVPSVPLADRSLVERARQHITAYARDPRLSPQMVAASLGVPLRRLQRRFAEVDASVGHEIRQARAQAAIAVLRSAEGTVLDLGTVARVCGYQHATALRRAFATLGLEAPSHYRRGLRPTG